MKCKKCGIRNDVRDIPVTAGIRFDCEKILIQLVAAPRLDWSHFHSVWSDHDFRNVLLGRGTLAETCELAEEILKILKSYLVRPGASYKERVAAFFLLYAVYKVQPVEGFAKIWATPEDKLVLDILEKEARQQCDKEVLYILGAMTSCGMIHCTSTERDHGLELKVLKYFYSSHQEWGLTDVGTMDEVEVLTELREIDTLLHSYDHMKNKLKDVAWSSQLGLVEGSAARVLADEWSRLGAAGAAGASLSRRRGRDDPFLCARCLQFVGDTVKSST